MPKNTLREIELLLFSLEREIDSTYCGVKHSAIYDLVERSLTVLEKARIHSELENVPGDALRKRMDALPELERRVYQLVQIDRVEIGGVAEQLELRPAKVIVILQRAQMMLASSCPA